MQEVGVERTLVLLKPDAIMRGLCGEIIHRFERAGLHIVGMKMGQISREFASKHYSSHVGKSFYKGLEDFIVESPLIAMVIEGVDAVENVRRLVGTTEPKKAAPGTIRGDYAHHTSHSRDSRGLAVANLIHASGNIEEAKQEVDLWFTKSELFDYRRAECKYTL